MLVRATLIVERPVRSGVDDWDGPLTEVELPISGWVDDESVTLSAETRAELCGQTEIILARWALMDVYDLDENAEAA